MTRTIGTSASAMERRRQRHEELREKLKGAYYINQLEEIDQTLKVGVDKETLEVLKVRIDLNLRRLKKVLPDEQYIEIEANFTGHEQALSELE